MGKKELKEFESSGWGMREIHIDDYCEIYTLWSRTMGMGMSDSDSEQNIVTMRSEMSFGIRRIG